MQRPRLLTAVLLATLAPGAAAESVSITNPGFEAPYVGGNLPSGYGGDVPATAFPTGDPPTGWSAWYEGGVAIGGASIGVLNPGNVFFTGGAPEGDNAALLYFAGAAGGNAFGVVQTLATPLAANTRYTLTVAVGNIASGTSTVEPYAGYGFFDLDGFPGYQVQLRANGVLLAQDDDTLNPAEGQFLTSTVQLITGAGPDQLGEPLEIRLVNLNNADVPGVTGLEVDFDHVRLDATAVPLPPALWLLLTSLAAMTGLVRRPV